jgi:hypothetical protein
MDLGRGFNLFEIPATRRLGLRFVSYIITKEKGAGD